MTDRINTLTVVLNHEMRADDCAIIADAIRQLRGVLTVTANVADGLTDHVAYERARRDLVDKMWDVLYPKTK